MTEQKAKQKVSGSWKREIEGRGGKKESSSRRAKQFLITLNLNTTFSCPIPYPSFAYQLLKRNKERIIGGLT